jgi:hypothetical protein
MRSENISTKGLNTEDLTWYEKVVLADDKASRKARRAERRAKGGGFKNVMNKIMPGLTQIGGGMLKTAMPEIAPFVDMG